MAQAISGVGEASAALGRNVFGVKRVVFRVDEMPGPERRRRMKRLFSELYAVRGALSKAELYSCVSGAAGGVAASAASKDGRLFALAPEAAAVEDDDGRGAAKSRKVSPSAERMMESRRDGRERLAGRLASMVAALPDHVVAFLLNRRAGDADPRREDGEIEMDDVQFVKDGALFQLKMLLDKFAPELSTPKLPAPEVGTPKSSGRRAPLALAASGISCLSQAAQHQGAGGRMPPVREEEEEDGINICGGVSRIAIRDIAEEYGELVDGVGVQLLSPLQRKYADLDEQDGYVDICGDASPVVFPAKTAGDSISSPSLSTSTDSDATSSSTDSDSSSTSPEALSKENSYRRAGEAVPAPEAIQIAEPESQCTAATAVFAITKSPPAPTVLPKECGGALAQPPEQAPEADQIAEPGELKEKRVAPATTVHPIAGGAPPPPAVLPNGNGTSSQPAPVPAPVAAQIAEPQPQPQPQPQAVQEVQTNDLIAQARLEWTRRAMAKARRKLLEMERAVPPDELIRPQDMGLLGIAAFEHVVSTVRDRDAPHQVNDGAGLRVSPGGPSILQQLGIFLKADGDGEEEDEADGEDMNMEIEDGQIL